MLDNDIVGDAARRPHTIRLFFEGVPTDETADEAALRHAVGGENDSPARQLARFVKEIVENDATGMHVALIFRRDRYLRGGDQIPFLEGGGYRSAVRLTEWRENVNHERAGRTQERAADRHAVDERHHADLEREPGTGPGRI